MPLNRFALFFFALVPLCSPPADAQTQLTREVDQIASLLVEQINDFGAAKTVAIADFTDLGYRSNALGKSLSEEFMTSMIMTPGKKFILVSRGQLKALLAEAKLDADGLLAPGNVPQLGRLKGIDLLIGATLTPSANEARLNLQGVHLESGAVPVGARGTITLTPSLKQLLGTPAATSAGETGLISSPPPKPAMLSIGNLKIETLGCRNQNNQLECRFNVTSLSGDTQLSIYPPNSRVVVSTSQPAGNVPHHVQLGSRSGSQRVTAVVPSGTATPLSVFIASAPSASGRIPKVELQCFSDINGTFTITLTDIPFTN